MKKVRVGGVEQFNNLTQKIVIKANVAKGTPDIPLLRAELKEKQKKFRRP